MSRDESLLARLTKSNPVADDEEAWNKVAATKPASQPVQKSPDDPRLSEMLQRIEKIMGRPPKAVEPPVTAETAPAAPPPMMVDDFVPLAKTTLAEMHLNETEVEALILKYLLVKGDALGREISDQTRLPFALVDELLRTMKTAQLLIYRGANEIHDYIYQLTDYGRERARRYSQYCTYFGAAPVALHEYIASVHKQSLTNQRPSPEDLQKAFSDIQVSRHMLNRLGPAMNAGRGLFLFGSPGNGKTSIARRISLAFGRYIWIPRALGIDGEIVRLYDPQHHVEAPLPKGEGLLSDTMIDSRWIRVQRPTIIVGGELTMAHLEITQNASTNICEAPLQLKSNCGTLVIDDFGRQRVQVNELLNRWIVPLEERVDHLSLPSGKTLEVPFDQLIVFSTNLEPRDLVDEAFLRRIAYKIEVKDPSEADFQVIFEHVANGLGMPFRPESFERFLDTHYRHAQRPLRCCHPRDILGQVAAICRYLNVPPTMAPEYLDLAVENYFSVM